MLRGLNASDAESIHQCLRDIVALSTLPTLWAGAEPLRIAESLAASLFTTLSTEFVYVSFADVTGRPPVAVAQVGRYESSPALASSLGGDLLEWARNRDPDELLILPNPLRPGTVRVTARPIGHHAELGVIAAAFADESSPTPTDQLLLNVGATQAATAVQNAYLLLSLRESEERIRRANAQLGERVTELHSLVHENARLLEDLRDADRRKDEFLATLAHELRNPLAPIRNMLEVMKLADGNPGLIQQARSTMERQLGHMTRLVDDLLDVSRVSRGKIELKRERVELASVLHQALEASRPLVESAGHKVSIALPAKPIYLNADPVRVAQIFGNIINNSCKYTEPGGKISLHVERQGDQVVIRVKDTGVGIPPDKLSSIFEMFTQVDRTLERSQGGLGIGLTLVKRLVEMHDGAVTAYSDGLGRGSEFVVRLPILCEDSRAEPSPEPIVRHRMARRILVVDDNQDSAMSLAMLLEATGNETQTAHDGVEAIEKAATYRPDVILLDIGLPRMNGYDVCRAIREQPWGEGIIVVALTGWGQDEDRRRSEEAGFDEHLVKPVDYAFLMKVLADRFCNDPASRDACRFEERGWSRNA